jgi:hypothetical protein
MNRLSLRLAGALLAAVVAGSFAGSPVSAQTSPLPSGSFMPSSGAAPAKPPAPAASHMAVAKQLVVASGLSRAFGGVVPEMMGKINTNFSQTRPEIAKDLKATLDALQPELALYADDMINFAGLVYTTLLSEQECKDALAFFNSPVGKKFIDSQPAIFGNLGPAMGEWSKSVSVRMMDRVRAEMKKKGHEL